MSTVVSLPASAERRVTVTAADGVALAVRVYGPADAAMTVVLLHGHCLAADSWIYLRDALRRRYPNARVVCYDHRGHGESDAAPWQSLTLAQLGRDLQSVLDAVAPTGPVVLVGHSMGGMTALTYAGMFPREFGARIMGVALIATAADQLAEHGFGMLLRNPVVGWFQSAVRRAPQVMATAKRVAYKALTPLINWAEYGDRTVSQRVITLASAMRNETPIVTMAAFLSAFMTYDETKSLPVLSAVPTLVLYGTADLMTPPSHSIAMAEQIDGAELVGIEHAGHSVIMERPDEVAAAVVHLIERVDGECCPPGAPLAMVA